MGYHPYEKNNLQENNLGKGTTSDSHLCCAKLVAIAKGPVGG